MSLIDSGDKIAPLATGERVEIKKGRGANKFRTSIYSNVQRQMTVYKTRECPSMKGNIMEINIWKVFAFKVDLR